MRGKGRAMSKNLISKKTTCSRKERHIIAMLNKHLTEERREMDRDVVRKWWWGWMHVISTDIMSS
jgi:hypothetical protein